MSKGGLRFLAAVLTTGIAVTPFLGLDDLPRGLQHQIDAEQKAYAEARTTFQRARNEVDQDLRSDPALFRAHSMITVFPERFRSAEGTLDAADRDMAKLAALRKANRRGDRAEAERLLKQEQGERTAALSEATRMQAEANRWVEMKRNLPQQLRQMQADYQAVRSADLSSVAATVEKAQADWPEKKADLQTRLDSLRAIPSGAEKTWTDSEPLRKQAAAGNYAGLDYAALLGAADSLHNAAGSVPAKSAELKNLTGQLYNSWDKVLVDLNTSRGLGGRTYREKIRTVSAQLTDASGKNAKTSTDENWVDVSQAEYRAAEKNLGMAIEHKPAGKYDVEAEKTAQPAGFAYMAPPGQRNQYGYWENRGGQNFWVWYGQYALLRDLLFNRDYRPLDTREYERYRDARRSGQTYYGRDAETNTPRYGTWGSSTQERYAGSTYGRSGGFKESPYATKPGGYGSSKYATRGYKEHPDEVAPRQFGSRSGGSGGFWSGGSGSSSRSWSSPSRSSRPSFGGGFSGGGRRFGGGGRRR